MKKAIFLLVAVLFLSGCNGFGAGTGASDGGVLKSSDGGVTWERKNKVDDKLNIGNADVLSLAINPANEDEIFLGTRSNGIYQTKDGAETWTKLNYPPAKTYGLAIDSRYPNIIYATGVWSKRGKIYKSEDSGASWKEIYTEPADGTVVISLAISKVFPEVVYAGTSIGSVVKTTDGGKKWETVFNAQGPVTQIAIDSADDKAVYFLVQNKGLMKSLDGGATGRQLAVQIGSRLERVSSFYSIEVDPRKSGTIYAGTSKGLLKSDDFGEKWEEIKTLSDPTKFPIRSIAVSPFNSDEIIYSAAQAIYKSTDGGKKWATFQLDISRLVRTMEYSNQSGVIYAGLSALEKK